MNPPVGALQRSFAVPLLLFGMALVAAAFLADIQYIDFDKAYYPAGRAVLTKGTFQYTYEGFKNLPIVAVLFVPLAALELGTAERLFLASELLVCLAGFATFLGCFARKPRDAWILLFLFLSCRHFYTCLRFGQLTPLCFLLLLWMVAAYERRRPVAAGVLLALAFVLKIPAGLFFFYFLVRRQWRMLAASAATYLALLAVSLLAFGLPLHRDYLDAVVLTNLGATLTAHNNVSIGAALLRFQHPERLFDWRMLEMPAVLDGAILAGLLLLCLGCWRATAGSWERGSLGERLQLSAAFCLVLLALPVVWDHYYLFLVFPAYFACQALVSRGLPRGGLLAGAAAWLLVNLPVLSLLKPPGLRVSDPTLRSALPAVPLLGCLTLLLLLMRLSRPVRSSPSVEGSGTG